MKQTFKLTKEILGKLASHSLEGYLFKEGFVLGEIEILFEQSSLKWREGHGGPDEIILFEFAPLCLCESLIHMQIQGWKITIGDYINDPS